MAKESSCEGSANPKYTSQNPLSPVIVRGEGAGGEGPAHSFQQFASRVSHVLITTMVQTLLLLLSQPFYVGALASAQVPNEAKVRIDDKPAAMIRSASWASEEGRVHVTCI